MAARAEFVYGFDPGFRHGALSSCVFEKVEGGKINLLAVVPVFVWTARTRQGIAERSSPTEVFKFSEEILTALAKFLPAPVVIDWDPYSVFWRARKMQSVILGLFIGYLAGGLARQGFYPVIISPSKVRETFHLNSRSVKQDVYGRFRNQVNLSFLDNPGVLRNEDILDSVVLSYLGFMTGV